jgi:pimeloyl-ACP methyl ester carboxylesterase
MLRQTAPIARSSSGPSRGPELWRRMLRLDVRRSRGSMEQAQAAALPRRHTARVGSGAHGSTFVLVHSPLVGPTSWLPVARELEQRGRGVVVPSLLGVADAAEPQWHHVRDAVRIATSDLRQGIILVGHSGAGLLLPVIADARDNEVAALIFVDSSLPPRGGRLQLGRPAFMDQLRAMATDGLLPPWSRWFGPDAMRELVPDERLRADTEAEMPRLPLSYFEATVPLPDDWANRRPCAYLLLSASGYGEPAAEARAHGWPVIEIDGVGHLAIATNPIQVTDALLDLERSMEQLTRSRRN